jgi:hypothetical protein
MRDTTDGRDITLGLYVDQAMTTEGRLYIKVGDAIHEVQLTEMGNRVIAATVQAATCMPQATKLYDGLAIQDMLGSTYVSIFPNSGSSHSVWVKELDEYKIVEAKMERNVLMVVGHKKGQYDRLVFRFSTADYNKYDVRIVEDITPSGLNFTVLDSGVAACITEDEKLELFAAKRGNPAVKVIDDAVLGNDMTLGKRKGKVCFWRGDGVYKMTMK